jgi:hypothetical protein
MLPCIFLRAMERNEAKVHRFHFSTLVHQSNQKIKNYMLRILSSINWLNKLNATIAYLLFLQVLVAFIVKQLNVIELN